MAGLLYKIKDLLRESSICHLVTRKSKHDTYILCAAHAQTKPQRSERSVADKCGGIGEDQLTGQAADGSFAMMDKGFTAAARPL